MYAVLWLLLAGQPDPNICCRKRFVPKRQECRGEGMRHATLSEHGILAVTCIRGGMVVLLLGHSPVKRFSHGACTGRCIFRSSA